MCFRSSSQTRLRCAFARALALWLLLLATPALGAPDDPRERLEAAIDTYQHGGYLEAAALLTSVLYPLKLTDRRDIVRAKVFLGNSYYVLGRKVEAEEEFRGVFKIDPGYQPDPLYIPGEILSFIERLRPPRTAPPARQPLLGLGEKPVEPDLQRFYWSPLNLVPLGIPQFARGDTGRGIALAATELGLLAINTGSYWYLKIYNDPTGQGNAGKYNFLIGAKALNISSLSFLAATLVVGAGDAVINHRAPRADVAFHFTLLPGPHPEAAVGLAGHF